ncbi:DNA polymerase III, partial [archaeon]|nr:DNA polymerase III [archaeon]
MKNQEVANLLHDIADLLELKGDLIFKINAYRKAAQNIENMTQPIEDVWKSGGLEKLPGIGKGISEHIDEYLMKGHSDYYEKMKKKMQMDFDSLRRIDGLGPKKIKALYEKLKIKTVNDLKSAANSGKIR